MPKKPSQSVALYERISTKDQKFASQHLQIQRYCKSHRIPCNQYRWYRDKKSGKNNERDGLQRMLKHVEKGKISTVVVYSLQRLSRSLLDGISVLQKLLDHNVRIISLSESIDLKGPSGRLVSNVLLSIFQFQREFQNEMIVNGIEARRKQGLPIGRPVDHKRRKRIQRLSDEGWTAQEIADKLKCTRQNIYKLLKSSS